MEKPEDFPKALYLSMAAEFLLFTVTGAYVYSKAGTQYTTAPAYGSLIEKYGKIAAGFTLPTIIIVGILYSLVTSRAVFFKIFKPHSVHRRMHTVKGWTVWVAIVTSGWVRSVSFDSSGVWTDEDFRSSRSSSERQSPSSTTCSPSSRVSSTLGSGESHPLPLSTTL
jgi:hypothetical protein